MTDPFEALATPAEPQRPRPAFARTLRAQLVAQLGLAPDYDALPTVALPQRSPAMSTTSTSTPEAAAAVGAAHVVPYLTVGDGVRALDWYADAFGAVEQLRVVGDDGRIGHAGFTIGGAEFMLSSDYPEIGVHSPTSLGGTSFAIHLTVANADAVFARAVAAGATALAEPADQPHGNRHGTLVDPFGHRWTVSQVLEPLDVVAYAERAQGSGFDVVAGTPANTGSGGTVGRARGEVWAVVFYEDALAGIRQLVDVFGFGEVMAAVGPDGTTVVHSELRWPEGHQGLVQVGTYDPASPHAIPPGVQSLYVTTADPQAVWERCVAAGLEVVQEPYEPHYSPGGMGFVVRDREGNLWSFGDYAGE